MPERGVVFYDAVMHQRDLAGLVKVRMGIDVAGQAMRGPARVADSERALNRFRFERLRQSFDAPHLFAHMKRSVRQDTYPGRVVPSVFEPPEAFNEQRRRFFPAYISNYATHVLYSFCLGVCFGNTPSCEVPV